MALALVATALVFARTLDGELVYDDVLLVGRNPYLADFSELPAAFSRGYWDFLGLEEARSIGYWRPLTAIAMTLVWHAFGGAVFGFHAFSVGIHLLATAAVFFLVRRLAQPRADAGWLAGASALLFGLHPMHVESVAWISALNDPLFGLFTVLALLGHLRWRERGSRGIPWAAALAFLLGLLAKELAAATVLLVGTLDLGRRRLPDEPPGTWGGFHSPRRAYGPYVLVLGLYFLARIAVFRHPLAGFERITTDFGVGLGRLWLLRAEILGGALRLLTWPLEPNLFRRFRPDAGLFDPAILSDLVAIAAYAGALAWLWKRRARPALFGWTMILASLLPVLVSVQSLGRFPLSDRFLYLPVAGFALVLALALGRLLPTRAATALVLLVAAGYGARSWERAGVWHDELALFERSAAQSPRSVYALWGLGRVYLDRANEARDPAFLEKAFDTFERASELLVQAKQPGSDLMVTSRDFVQVNLGLAWCYILKAQLDPSEGYATPIAILEQLVERITEVQERVRKARDLGIRVESDYFDLEKVYTALGVAQSFAGKTDAAIESFRRALALQPNYVEALENLGRLYIRQNKPRLAREFFERALERQPGDFETRLLVAQAAHEQGDFETAERLARELHDQRPEASAPMVVLGAIRLARGDASKALTWLERATRADPRNGHAWYLQAKALLQRNAASEAIGAFRNATRFDPDSFEAHYDFGGFLLNSGAIPESLPYLVRAYELSPPAHLPALRRTLSALPDLDPDLLARLARADLRRHEPDTAETWLDRALAADPDHAPSLVAKSRLLRSRGRHAEALDALRQAARLRPDDFSLHLELGLYLADRSLPAEARRTLQHALELGPPASWHPDAARDARAQIQDLLGRLEEEDPPTRPETGAESGDAPAPDSAEAPPGSG